MAFTAPMKVSADLKPDFIALRDALATLPVEEARAIVGAAITQARNPVPTEVAAPAPMENTTVPAPTVAKIRTSTSAPRSTRRPPEPKPVEEEKVTIIVRNGSLLADTIAGRRYSTDNRIQVSPQELEAIEADLAKRPKYWGASYTRIERVI